MAHAGSINVAVRVRPPTEWEASRLPEPTPFDHLIRGEGTLSSPRKVTQTSNVRNIVDVVDDRILTFDPPERDIAKAFSERGFMPPGSKRYKDRRFLFDRVFDGQARQIDVYENTTQSLLDGLLDGYNSTVFAYGATGCGKTFTISGSDNDPGIIYLAMADLFQRIEDKKEETTYGVAVTFLEIYNEEIRDLLAEPGSHAPRGGLAIREDKHVKVVNLTELRPANADEVKDIVILGNQRRTQSPTHANETSSRSHAVLQVHVTQAPRTANTTETRTMATLSIIDLAGSERASATKNMGERMIEGANINKSLLALGNCINALCDSGGAARHIPYRNSKLTRLLKFSLGGNCKTVMIVCVAPTSVHFEDTHNALVYAERATKIKTKVVTRNVLNVNRHVGQYVEAINRLNEEVAHLKAKLADRQAGVDDSTRRKRTEMLSETNRVKSDIVVKVNQNKASVGEGAKCKAILDVTEAKMEAIRKRASTPSTGQGQDSSQLEAERLLLDSLASQQQAILRPDSAISARLHRSRNTDNLFEATLKAVAERRAVGKLDDVAAQNVQLLVECAKSEIRQHRSEEASKAYQEALEQQTPVLLNLFSLVARCTVMLRHGAQALQSGMPGGSSDATMLQSLATSVDQELVDLVGFGIPQVSETPSVVQSSVLRSIQISDSTARPSSSAAPKAVRRPSNLNSSPKKTHRSPRKSRVSLSKLRPPIRRESEKKTVRWKEDIQSSIAESSLRKESPLDLGKARLSGPAKSAPSVCSESDWEDEKTEDSMGVGLNHPPLRRISIAAKRTRNSRLDPAFLRTREPILESLLESGDEDNPSPFTDKINQPPVQRTTTSKKPRLNEQRSNSTVQRGARRISSIGPMRSSRNRRRSSILMESRIVSASHQDENVRPNPLNDSKLSMASRRKRSSSSKPFRPLASTTYVPNASVLVNGSGNNTSDASGEASFRGIKPTWR